MKENDYKSICKNIVEDDVKAKTNEFMKLCGEKTEKTFQLNLSAKLTEETNSFKELESIIFK